MKIKEAIKHIQELEKNGAKNIILACWEAEDFGEEDDKKWEDIVNDVDNIFDWSSTHEDLKYYINSIK